MCYFQGYEDVIAYYQLVIRISVNSCSSLCISGKVWLTSGSLEETEKVWLTSGSFGLRQEAWKRAFYIIEGIRNMSDVLLHECWRNFWST